MNRYARVAQLASSLVLLTTVGMAAAARGDDAGPRDIPPAFAPFEYLVGRWKGQGIPRDKGANQFRGWTETHTWAWIFAKGKPAGLSVTIEGGKVLAAGKLSYDQARNRYLLEATEPRPLGGRISFEGTLDESRKLLVLDRTAATGKSARDSGKMRLSLHPNANFVRYTMTEDRQEPGAFAFARLIEVGLTREGESFAGGSTASERPKCIVTGGAAAMTLTYQGRTFSICCTGCRDEFNDNPEKYVKKAALMLGAEGAKPKSNQPATSRVNRFEDAFAGDVVDSSAARTPSSKQEKTSPASTKKANKGAEASPSEIKPQQKPAAKKDSARSAASKLAGRAATLLRLGQNLEKTGKTTAALTYFRRIVKDFPDTPAAKTAAERIKALDGG
ncbi:MAG: tetratricopeptide repeat protein [Isosphaerales bacterium]